MDYTAALLAGGLAGTAVDLSLFPLDTLKTRLQAGPGQFWASGGFSGIYRGVGSAVVGSAPGAALFFVTYEGVKGWMSDAQHSSATTHMLSASLGEIAACAVRVPTEVVKQRAQAGQHASSAAALAAIVRSSRGSLPQLARALYRGGGATILREVPFTVVQFPLWEAMRQRWSVGVDGSTTPPSAVASAAFGSIAGAVAAAVTTPLDVLKTRIMLSPDGHHALPAMVRDIHRRHGSRAFFAGIGPRVTWISIGGAIFLGTYQLAVNTLRPGEQLE
ncbi:mitochondrial carrier protein [Grosmannia clavigera kw1407]|uniref:Mitochondrial carrier protein n=1 Tax=Grosmannia clavigera (strain kw1407 / UAMH 11150) TaxID=655863 RepID=F0XV49_GROCL|nr:mitochondrial carrier protein [Grosmannia clavigera kw1407]EFW98434.1 mitochondrial carrier protein [Grosmannia clavigera kw1407]